jgi:hypothetical protein
LDRFNVKGIAIKASPVFGTIWGFSGNPCIPHFWRVWGIDPSALTGPSIVLYPESYLAHF